MAPMVIKIYFWSKWIQPESYYQKYITMVVPIETLLTTCWSSIIMVGETHYNHLDASVYIFDTSGTFIQSNLFGTPSSSEQFYDAKPTSDGGCIMAGFSAIPNVTGNDILLAKFDSSLQLSWIRSYDLVQ